MNIPHFLIPFILLCWTGYKISNHEITDEFTSNLNKLIINFSLPSSILLASNDYNLKSMLDIKFCLCYLFSIIIPFLIGFFLLNKIIKRNITDSIFAGMNASISNSGLIAIPILIGLFGTKCIGATIAILITSSIIIPLLIIFIEYEKVNRNESKIKAFTHSMLRTLKAPYAASIFIGIALNVTSIKIPDCITTYLNYLTSLTIPCAFILIGMRLSKINIASMNIEIALISFINSFIKPAIAYLIAVSTHLTSIYACALIIISSSPVASTIHILADKYDSYKSESAQIAILTLITSFFSLSFFIWLSLKKWGSI
jgi:malonate transporter